LNIAKAFQDNNAKLQYQVEAGGAARLLYEYLHPDLPKLPAIRKTFRSNRSMRDVEANVDLSVRPLNEWGAGR
jgi:hypothetical protein